jgi:LDH2 family malate/lactate/ureidoglycolate dehydrogenase
MEVVRQKGATAFLTANGSMGHVVAHKAMLQAIDLAKVHGISLVSVKDSGHFGVAGLFPAMALKEDMIGYVCSNSAPMMAPFGGRKRIIGNNPLSYAFPADKKLPVTVDFSCSVVSSGKLILTRKKGEKIPLGWAVDKNGMPTTDPYEGYEGGGSLAYVGAHKGYGLALINEIFTALITGGKWTQNIKSLYEEDKTGIQGTCHSFMVIDPECFVGIKEFKRSMDEYIESIKTSPKAEGVDEILMPGEIEDRCEKEQMETGIRLSPNTLEDLNALAGRIGIDQVKTR